MRAVVLDDAGLPELAELPEPSGPGLLVRVRACGLCGSDVEKLGRAASGTVLGHEIAGEPLVALLPNVGLELAVGAAWLVLALLTFDRLAESGRRDGSIEFAN